MKIGWNVLKNVSATSLFVIKLHTCTIPELLCVFYRSISVTQIWAKFCKCIPVCLFLIWICTKLFHWLKLKFSCLKNCYVYISETILRGTTGTENWQIWSKHEVVCIVVLGIPHGIQSIYWKIKKTSMNRELKQDSNQNLYDNISI